MSLKTRLLAAIAASVAWLNRRDSGPRLVRPKRIRSYVAHRPDPLTNRRARAALSNNVIVWRRGRGNRGTKPGRRWARKNRRWAGGDNPKHYGNTVRSK